MCYPRGAHCVGVHDKLGERRGRFVPPDTREDVQIQVSSISTGNIGAAVGMTKQCVCSPTHHPGSFRCRHHHSDYKWQNGTKSVTRN
ncbi:hypothetical protein A4A49_11552 [Nicotiana attenuata]|uniref:Uncharacterized protein n=1 Tax=Nicotiana attenuata TaxID=49451 RepID=A0A314L803_NICAT|nr:hypothetical protein A4A49_11552 [Nicotiana attenuata]